MRQGFSRVQPLVCLHETTSAMCSAQPYRTVRQSELSRLSAAESSIPHRLLLSAIGGEESARRAQPLLTNRSAGQSKIWLENNAAVIAHRHPPPASLSIKSCKKLIRVHPLCGQHKTTSAICPAQPCPPQVRRVGDTIVDRLKICKTVNRNKVQFTRDYTG